MKKGFVLMFLALFLSIFLISSVSAAQSLTDLAKGAIDGVVSILQPYLQALLGPATDSSEIFMGKLLIIIILISISYVALGKGMEEFFEGKPWALWVISIAVGLLGVRFLTPEFVQTIILPNSAFAVAVTALLPLVLYFFIVDVGMKSPVPAIIRRFAWIFFAVVFLGLYTIRFSDLGDIAWIYPLTALLAFLMALMDGTIQRFFTRLNIERVSEERRDELRREKLRQLQEVDEDFANGIITPAKHTSLQRKLRSQIDQLSK